MSEITILDTMPMILTKNEKFLKDARDFGIAKAGKVLLLPEDAVLVSFPITLGIPTEQNDIIKKQ